MKRFGRFWRRWYGRLMRRDPHEQPEQPERQLTPEECERLSAATQDLAYPLSVTDAEQVEEEVHGKPLKYGTAGAAADAMRRRLRELRQQKAQLLNTLDDCSPFLARDLEQQLIELNQSIADTQQRLDAYGFQGDKEN